MFSRISPALTTALAVICLCVMTATTWSQEVVEIDFGRGDVDIYVPEAYDEDEPMPLVLLLHGFTGTGAGIESYWDMIDQADDDNFLLAYPDGTVNAFGARFWNGTPACCAGGASVDDSRYLFDMIGEMRMRYNVDAQRIYVTGHSNGGFMSHRMACDHSDTIAAIGSLAGATYPDSDDCEAEYPMHVLQIHGTSDSVISYDGGFIGSAEYPGAVETLELWAELSGCTLDTEDGGDLNLDFTISGEETSITRYVTDCDASGSSELWSIDGGAHSPFFNDLWAPNLVEYFYDHPKDCGVITSQQQRSRVFDEDPRGGDEFGHAIALSGSWLLVGAQRDDEGGITSVGSVDVFHRQGRDWEQIIKLTVDTGESGDRFGSAVSLDGTFALIGAARDDTSESTAGSAWIFERGAAGPDDWQQAAQLLASDPTEGAQFGGSVTLVGDVAVIGAGRDDSPESSAGSVYVFRHTNGSWVEEQKLVASDPSTGDEFGTAVAFDGETIAVGARLWEDDLASSGAVYLFGYDDDAEEWEEIALLEADDAAASDRFGSSVLVVGGTVAVGAPRTDDGGSNSGSVYVFEEDAGAWSQVQELVASDASSGDRFGEHIALDGDHLVVTAPYTDSDRGAAYVFRYDSDADEWFETQIASAVAATEDGDFGFSVAIQDATIVVGAPAGDSTVGGSGQVAMFHVADCNDNGLMDSCDLAAGDSDDCNLNGTPDECETLEIDVVLAPEAVDACLGGSVTLAVIADGDPQPTYQWRFDGDDIAGATEPTFTLDDVSLADDGTYELVLAGECAETTVSLELSVLDDVEAVSISDSRADATSYVGGAITLEVVAGGDDLAYQWFHAGQPIIGASSATLALDPVAATDAGTYEVLVSNSCGSLTSSPAELTVLESAPFRRADVDGDGVVEALDDALFLLEWAFASGAAPQCMDAADVDDDGVVFALLDVFELLRWAFADGDAPPAPGTVDCGLDPTEDLVECDLPTGDCL